MKTYTAPAVVTHDILGTTMLNKTVASGEIVTSFKPQGSPNLGFGL
jgi:hypothetical protein